MLLATGYDYLMPYVDPALFDWRHGRPDLYLNVVHRDAGRALRARVRRVRRRRLPAVRRDGPARRDGRARAPHRRAPDELRRLRREDHPDLRGGHHYVDSPRHADVRRLGHLPAPPRRAARPVRVRRPRRRLLRPARRRSDGPPDGQPAGRCPREPAVAVQPGELLPYARRHSTAAWPPSSRRAASTWRTTCGPRSCWPPTRTRSVDLHLDYYLAAPGSRSPRRIRPAAPASSPAAWTPTRPTPCWADRRSPSRHATWRSPTVCRRPAAGRGSVGPYGAMLHDGSEYAGTTASRALDAGRASTPSGWTCWPPAGPDLLAVETVPDMVEAEVLVELLDGYDLPAWVSYRCTGGRAHLRRPAVRRGRPVAVSSHVS